MARKWGDLSDEEQKDAVSTLHAARRDWKAMYPTHLQLELLEVAINHLDASRRRYNGGMTGYGVGIVVVLFNKAGEILVGKRKGSQGAGTWGLPGGKLESKKSALAQVRTELLEETGIDMPVARFHTLEWVDNIWDDKDRGLQHWVTLFTQAAHEDAFGIPKVMEPGKCEEWLWVKGQDLVDHKIHLFPPLARFVELYPHIVLKPYVLQEK